MKKILIAGSTGNIGSALVDKISKDPNYKPIETRSNNLKEDQEYLDFNEKITVNFSKYSHLVIAAGITKIKECEDNEDFSYKINVASTIKLIKNAQDQNCFIIFLSSNNVFDGKLPNYKFNDETCPNNVYGKHKVLVEEYLQTNYFNNSCILRLTKVINSQNNSFIKKWDEDANNLGYFNVLKNYLISPLSLDDATNSILKCIKFKKNGIFQKSGDSELSYLDYAKEYYKNKPEMLKKIKITDEKNDTRYGSLTTKLPSLN